MIILGSAGAIALTLVILGIIGDRTGKNHPHAIVYIGGHPERFLRAFSEIGIPMKLESNTRELAI